LNGVKREDGSALSRAPVQGTAAERADNIIKTNAATAKPLDLVAKTLTKITGIERLTGAVYDRAEFLLDRCTPEKVYVRYKEALVKTRASRGVAMGTFKPNHASSTGAVPATIALHRDPRDKAIVFCRGLVVKKSRILNLLPLTESTDQLALLQLA
jgi:hypothetical protein